MKDFRYNTACMENKCIFFLDGQRRTLSQLLYPRDNQIEDVSEALINYSRRLKYVTTTRTKMLHTMERSYFA